jgi:hypothetical protein
MPNARTWLRAAVWSLSLGCAAPPTPTAEHARPAPSVANAGVPVAERCGMVRRAERTWVGFAEGMTPDDMMPAGLAAGEVVHALDAALCGLRRGAEPAALRAQSERLRTSAADGGGFEVTQVLWQDAALTRAEVELHARSASWLASVVRDEERWRISRFASKGSK